MEKNLFVVRHAKSSWDNPGLADIDRPLNGRGKRNAPEMGMRLKRKELSIDLIISSPARRAHKTAKAIAKEIGYPKKDILVEPQLYHGGIGQIFDVLHKQSEENKNIMIFGHNPGFTWFVNELCNIDIDNIPTCGVVSVSIQESWNQIKPGAGKLLFFDYPKKTSG